MQTAGGWKRIDRLSLLPQEATKPVEKSHMDRQVTGKDSPILAALLTRRSVLESNGRYDEVARAVLATNASSARAELRASRLRASAKSKNWLPSVGPSISLTSLGDVVAGLVFDQVLFDNGRRKAERAFARADVEVAAVALVDDSNARVYEAIGLYLDAAEGRELAAVFSATLDEMKHFKWILSERVNAGISDPSDLTIAEQTVFHIRSDLQAAEEQQRTAQAELMAMTQNAPVTWGGPEELNTGKAEALRVVHARADKSRAIEEAKMAGAGLLPSITASASANSQGSRGLSLGALNIFQPGSKDALAALEEQKDAAHQKLLRTQEKAAREDQRVIVRLEALKRQEQDARKSVTNTEKNLVLFQKQYKGGQRQIMDVISLQDTLRRAQQNAVALKYEHARLALKRARDLGLLVDGVDA